MCIRDRYVPTTLIVGVAVFPPETMLGPLHAKLTPEVEELPERIAVAVVQDITWSVPALALGGVIFCVTITASDAVQPFAGLVAVTVYVFGVDIVLFAVFVPLLHAKVALVTIEVASSTSEVLTQFNTVSIPAFTVGGVLSLSLIHI